MAFSNVFDSSLVDYSDSFQYNDQKHIDEIKKEWFDKIVKVFDRTANNFAEYRERGVWDIGYPWESLYKYSSNINGEPFVSYNDVSSIRFMIPQNNKIKSYNGTLSLEIYVSKPKKNFVAKYNKLTGNSYLQAKISGDPNTYFKYKLADLSSGYNDVLEGEVHYNIEKTINELPEGDIHNRHKLQDHLLKKLYEEIKIKSITESIDYILENY